MDNLTTQTLSESTGESIRKIQHYVGEGLLVPTSAAVWGRGRGRPSVFPEQARIEVKMIQVLLEDGLTLKRVKVFMDALRNGKYRGEDGEVEFHDFFTNPAWGRDLELLCWASPQSNEAPLMRLEKGVTFKVKDLGGRVHTLYHLGRIKNEAIKRLARKP